MHVKLVQLKQIFSHTSSYVLAVGSGFLLGFGLFYFTDLPTILGNLGQIYEITLVTFQILIAILFGINVAVLVDRFKQAAATKKTTGISAFAGFLAMLVSGCTACGITLASYIGLGTALASLPFYGLELKLLAIILLAWATWSLLKPVACKI